MGFFSKSEKEKESDSFEPKLERGLYFGGGVEITEDPNGGTTVIPIFVAWGDLAGHTAVYGTTRVGKTRLMVSLIRQVIIYGWDILLVEPKGSVGQETLAWMLQFAEEAGRLRDVKYISPMFPELSYCFNPLYNLSNEEIASLVSTIIPAKDEFFAAIGYSITMAVLLGLQFLEKAEGKEAVGEVIRQEYRRVYSGSANIIDEIEHISDPDLATRIVFPGPNEKLSDIDPPFRSTVTFADLATYSTQEGLNAILDHVNKVTEEQYNGSQREKDDLKKLKSEAVRALTEQAEKDKGFFSKVASSFNLILQQLSTGQLGEILCSVKINPVADGFKNKTHGQILIIQPYPLIYKKASDAFVRVFFAMLTALYGNIGAAGREIPRKIAMFVDEGGSVLYPGVEALFNKAGGLGLRIFIFTQSFADYDNELGAEISAIVNDNTNIKLYMRMNDPDSRKQISESFGKALTKTSNYSGSKLDLKVSAGESERYLLLPTHIASMGKQEFLLQYGEGRYLCAAPVQDDPTYWVDMPILASEELYNMFAKEFAITISELKKEKEILAEAI
jgi:hypothetical protein